MTANGKVSRCPACGQPNRLRAVAPGAPHCGEPSVPLEAGLLTRLRPPFLLNRGA
jgi:hypothetical protein